MVRRVKQLLTTLCLVLLSSYSYSEEISSDQVVNRGGIVSEINSTIPFSGTVLWFRDDGQLEFRENYKEGVLDGLVENFYENGQIDMRGNWRNGKEEGLFEWFWDDGKPKSKGNYKDGKKDGLWEYNYDYEKWNPTKTEEWKDGKLIK